MLLGSIAYAQSPNNNTGTNVATVNIILHDIQALVVTPGQEVIDLVYDSPEDYINGVQVTKSDHLQVFSTQDYYIKSAVWQENLITQNDIYVNNVLQSRLFQTIEQGVPGSRNIDITYGAKGNNEYLTKNKQTYTTQVIYEIVPK